METDPEVTDDADADGGIANLRPLEQAQEQKAWYWYDWANSAYATTIGTVFFGPYFISLAENAVGGRGPAASTSLGFSLAARTRCSSG